MHLTTKYITIILAAVICILTAGCAKVMAPTGGPKDSTPPKVLKIIPENQSVRFSEKTIKLYFDEYITLSNPGDNVLISPPISKSPDYQVKGKTLVIKFKDTLQANTTYNMHFSNCIKDYHEGNPISLFHYSFSTGDSLDDYTLRGKVLDAQTATPSADMFVMLYKNDNDSLPFFSLPDYITKTQEDGSFMFRNITAGDYKIFALKDINADFRYDLPNEEIAFPSSLVSAYRSVSDSVADSLKVETPQLALYSFLPEDTVQHLSRFLNPALGIYRFPYKRAVKQFSAIASPGAPDYFQVINPTRDTITWFMKSPITDSAVYFLNADGLTDTVLLTPFKERQTSGRHRPKAVPKMNIAFSNAGEYHKPLMLKFPYPIQPRDSFDVYVFSQQMDAKDTTVYRFGVPDTFLMELPLPMSYLEKKTYSIMIPDSLFYGYHQLSHDTLRLQFSTKSVKDYGSLIMNYVLPDDGKTYVATLSQGNVILQEDVLTSSKTITYPFLLPTNYKVSVFCDENNNEKWDTGDYYQKRQPERVIVFPKEISIRAYWDTEETFTIQN